MNKEKRYYVISYDELEDEDIELHKIPDDEFQTLAEANGRIYTESGFVEAFNQEEVNTVVDILRIVDVNTEI